MKNGASGKKKHENEAKLFHTAYFRKYLEKNTLLVPRV